VGVAPPPPPGVVGVSRSSGCQPALAGYPVPPQAKIGHTTPNLPKRSISNSLSSPRN